MGQNFVFRSRHHGPIPRAIPLKKPRSQIVTVRSGSYSRGCDTRSRFPQWNGDQQYSLWSHFPALVLPSAIPAWISFGTGSSPLRRLRVSRLASWKLLSLVSEPSPELVSWMVVAVGLQQFASYLLVAPWLLAREFPWCVLVLYPSFFKGSRFDCLCRNPGRNHRSDSG